MVAQNEGSDGDYEAWVAEGAEELVAAPVMVAELGGSEADYESWDGEGDAIDAVDEAELAGAIEKARSAMATRDDSADYAFDDAFEP